MPKAKSPSKQATGAAANGDARTNGSIPEPKKQTSAQSTNPVGSTASRTTVSKTSAPQARATETSVHPSVSEEQIRRRAYELYTQRGGGDGQHAEDWFRAEAELLGRH